MKQDIQQRIGEIETQMATLAVKVPLDGGGSAYTITFRSVEDGVAYKSLERELGGLKYKAWKKAKRDAYKPKHERMLAQKALVATAVAEREALGLEVGREVRNETNDCGVVAVQHCFGVSYDEAYAKLKALGRKDRKGTKLVMLEKLGLVEVPLGKRMSVGEALGTFGGGKYIIYITKHVFAVVDGVNKDCAEVKLRSRVKAVFMLPSPTMVK